MNADELPIAESAEHPNRLDMPDTVPLDPSLDASPQPDLSPETVKLEHQPEVDDPWSIQEASVQTLLEEEQTTVIEQTAGPEEGAGHPTEDHLASLETAVSVADLQQREQTLRREIAQAEAYLAQLREQILQSQSSLGQLIQEGLKELEQRKQALQISVEQLERRQERVRAEMRTTFAGVSQDLAIRVQSFKDYLVGSLQDLAMAADQLEFPKLPQPSSKPQPAAAAVVPEQPSIPKFAEQSFQEQTKRIRKLLDQYRHSPDYYGPPWQLRRTFEPIHAERVSNWFFTQGGRGAIRTMGSRLQNILVASAVISVLRSIYDERVRMLVLADSPERLGEWRRGLQDCLGITRSDFGPDRGVTLFEDPFPLSQKADRLVKEGLLPLIVIDETEDLMISLSLLQFPLWLAFAPNPQQVPPSSYY
jgi:hypothetical protein